MLVKKTTFHPASTKRQLIVVLFLSVLLVIACQPSSETPVAAAKTMAESVPALNIDVFPENHRNQARAFYTAIEASPEEGKNYGLLAMLAQSQGLAAIASTFYGRAVDLSPSIFEWHYLYGIVLSEQGNVPSATEIARRAYRIRNNYPPLNLRLAELLIQQQQFEEAEALLETLVKSHPNYAQAHAAFGQYQLDRGESEAGIEHLNRAVSLAPNFGSAHYALANAYTSTGDRVKASFHRTLFEQHQKSRPVNSDPILARVEDLRGTIKQAVVSAARLSASGRLQEAANVLEKVLEREPDNAVAHINLIGLHGELGNFEQAESHYHAGKAVVPDDVKLHNNYGVLLLKQSRYAEAADTFRAAIKTDPNYGTPYKYLGLSLQHLGQKDEALESFQQAFQKNPLDFQAGYFLGNAFMQKQKFSEAIDIFDTLSTVDSAKTPQYLRAKASAHYANKNIDKATDALVRAKRIAQTYKQNKIIEEIDKELAVLANAQSVKP